MLIVDCDPLAEQCCTDLYDVAHHLLTVAYDALLECIPASECGPLGAYVTLGNGDDGVVDAVKVSFQTTAMSNGSTINGRTLPMPLLRGIYEIRLLESGWPTARTEGEVVVPPQPQEQVAAARQLYAHGEKMYRALLQGLNRRELTPERMKNRCNANLGPLTPITPRGGTAGWLVAVTVDLLLGAP